MRYESFNFSDDFQDAIIKCLLIHPDKFGRIGEVLEPGFFNGVEAMEVCVAIKEFDEEFGKYPTFVTLSNYMFHRNERQNPKQAERMVEYVNKIAETDISDWEYIRKVALKFARERAIFHAISEIGNDQIDRKLKLDPVAMMEKAMRVGESLESDGIELGLDGEKVIREASNKSLGIWPGMPLLDSVWPYGWQPGWLVSVLAPPKRYKCEDPNTEILMYDGNVKLISEIKPGDKVMGDDSTPRLVLSCGHGSGPMYRVTQANGDNYTVTHDHPLCVKHSHSGKLMEITAEDYVQKSKWFQRTWKGYKVAVDFPKSTVPLDPYFLGLWLGDGHSAAPIICTGDSEIVDYVYEFAEKNNLKIKECKNSVNSVLLRLSQPGKRTNYVTRTLRNLGVINSKHIPKLYRINDKTTRINLLAGLLDSDGNHTKNRGFIFTNNNKKMCEDACWIARSLGFKSFVRRVKTVCTNSPSKRTGYAYRTYIQGDIDRVPVKIKRKIGVPSARASTRTTIRVNPVGNRPWFGIEIDGNRRYLHNDFTVTHNTTFCLNVAMNIAMKQPHQDVLYYACEISQTLACMRAIYRLTDTTEEALMKPRGVEKVIGVFKKEWKTRVKSRVWFMHYPSKSANVNMIKRHAKRIINQYGLEPKAIVIDYAETIRPNMKDKNAPDWRQSADVYTDARAMAEELKCVVIMPDRCNAAAVGKKVPNMKSFQGAFEKAGIVDVALGLCATGKEHKANQIRVFVFLNRHGKQYDHFNGFVVPDKYHMELTEIGDDVDPDAEENTREGSKSYKPREPKDTEVTPNEYDRLLENEAKKSKKRNDEDDDDD